MEPNELLAVTVSASLNFADGEGLALASPTLQHNAMTAEQVIEWMMGEHKRQLLAVASFLRQRERRIADAINAETAAQVGGLKAELDSLSASVGLSPGQLAALTKKKE